MGNLARRVMASWRISVTISLIGKKCILEICALVIIVQISKNNLYINKKIM